MRLSFCLPLLLCLTLCAELTSAQSAGTRATANPPRQREQWFEHGRALPGQSAAALRYRAHRQKLELRAWRAAAPRSAGVIALPRDAPGTVWKPLGPAPLASDASGTGVQDYGLVTGRATAVAVDPADGTGNTVYIGGAYGGVWKSVNAGALSPNPSSVTWTPITDDQPTLAVGAIAIQPQLSSPDPNKSVILVGTGETNSSSDSYYGLGILRSDNAGNTWTLISQDATGNRQFAGLGFSQIAFSTVNPSVVVAAAAGATQGVIEGLEDPVIANRGLYYSNDGGQSWNYATVNDAGLVIAPSSATSVVYNATARKFFAAIQWHGVYSSSDGATWSRLNNQPGGLSPVSCPASPSTASCLLYRGEFAVVPGRNEMYFWYVDGNNTDRLIWQTKDGGGTWTQLNDDGITNCGDALGGCGTEQGAFNLELAAVPDGEVTDLYAGAVNLYKCRITTADPGCDGVAPDTFINLTHAYGCPPNFGSIAHVHPNQHALSFLNINNNSQVVMYFANDGGIYRALDGYTGLITGDVRRQQPVRQSERQAGVAHPGGFFFAASHRSEYDFRRRAGHRLARDQQLAKQPQLGERELGRRRLQPDQSGQSHRLVYRQHRREHPALRFWRGLPGAGFQQRAGGFGPHAGRRFRRIVHAFYPGPTKFRRAAGGHVPGVARRLRWQRIRCAHRQLRDRGHGELQRQRGQPGAVAGRRRPQGHGRIFQRDVRRNRWPGPAASHRRTYLGGHERQRRNRSLGGSHGRNQSRRDFQSQESRSTPRTRPPRPPT